MSDVNDPIPMPIFGIAARGLMELVSSRLVHPPVNLVISNVRGSPEKLACHGAPLLAHYPMSLVFDGFTPTSPSSATSKDSTSGSWVMLKHSRTHGI
jgi:hypothetical protein